MKLNRPNLHDNENVCLIKVMKLPVRFYDIIQDYRYDITHKKKCIFNCSSKSFKSSSTNDDDTSSLFHLLLKPEGYRRFFEKLFKNNLLVPCINYFNNNN